VAGRKPLRSKPILIPEDKQARAKRPPMKRNHPGSFSYR